MFYTLDSILKINISAKKTTRISKKFYAKIFFPPVYQLFNMLFYQGIFLTTKNFS